MSEQILENINVDANKHGLCTDFRGALYSFSQIIALTTNIQLIFNCHFTISIKCLT